MKPLVKEKAEILKKYIDYIVNSGINDLSQIVLIGSYARGDACAKSNFNIVVITKVVINDVMKSADIRCELDSFDNIPATVEFFISSEIATNPSNLAKAVNTEGIVLWEGGVLSESGAQLLLVCNA